MPEQVQLVIAQPPDQLFKYRYNRQAPAMKVMEAENSIFMLEKFDLEQSQGIYAYFKGVPYPAKGWPFPEAVYAINFAKKLIRESLSFMAKKDLILMYLGLVFTPKKYKLSIISRMLRSYRLITDATLLPYYLQDRYYSPFCAELKKFIITFVTGIGIDFETASNFAENFVILIEFDNAYRLRLEDLFSETTKEKLLNDTRKELSRLVEIVRDREPAHEGLTFDKFDHGVKIISYLLYLPWIRKAFRKALEEADFEKLQLDDADRFHVLLWADYNFLGKSIAERIEMYKQLFTNEKGELVLPPRMTYSMKPK